MRLACVKHAASVRSEPGSNSQVHQHPGQPNPTGRKTRHEKPTQTPTNRPNSTVAPPDIPEQPSPSQDQTNQEHPKATFKAFVTHKTNTSPTPLSPAKSRSILANPNHNQTNQSPTTLSRISNTQDAANVSLPSLYKCQRAPPRRGRREPNRSAAGGAF